MTITGATAAVDYFADTLNIDAGTTPPSNKSLTNPQYCVVCKSFLFQKIPKINLIIFIHFKKIAAYVTFIFRYKVFEIKTYYKSSTTSLSCGLTVPALIKSVSIEGEVYCCKNADNCNSAISTKITTATIIIIALSHTTTFFNFGLKYQ